MVDYLTIVISAVVGGVVAILVERLNDHIKMRRKKELLHEEERKNRPEFQVIKMKDFFHKSGENTHDRSCDLEVYVMRIDGVDIVNDEVIAKFNKDNIIRENWVCYEYTLRNVGKTSVYELYLISHAQKTACLFDVRMVNEKILNYGLLNYSQLYDRRIGPDQKFTLKICYHKQRVFGGIVSAQYGLGMRDDKGNYWLQPFFAPEDKLYKSYRTTYKKIKKLRSTDIAIACFKNPRLW